MAQQDSAPAEGDPVVSLSRREVLAKLANTVFAALIAPTVLAQNETTQTEKPHLPEFPELPEAQPDEDPLIRMMRDLQRALQKPVKARRWVMVIDLRKCVGCHACTIACIAENKLPPGVIYRSVTEEEVGTFPKVTRRFLPRPCMQCDNPPCIPVCPVKPTKATYKRPDGIVAIDYDLCIGCGRCVRACPYGARSVDEGRYYTEQTPPGTAALFGQEAGGVYERTTSFEYGRVWKREGEEPPIDKARKCHFCLHRIERGLLPMCVTTCIGRATFFGDAKDPESLIVELLKKPNVMRLKEKLGTNPRVYYLT